jgi:hypothetical protein
VRTSNLTAIDVVSRFRDIDEVSKFLSIHCQRLIRYAKKDNPKFLPFVYKEDNEIFSFSFDFFIQSIAKFYDAGNEKVEEEINDMLKLSSSRGITDVKELLQFNKDRSLIIIGLFQEYFNVIFPNNRKINATRLKGIITTKDSYFIPIVYENSKKEPIQYEMLPAKKNRLLELGVSLELIEELINLNRKYGLKDVAFNAANVNNYWNGTSHEKVIRFE